MANYLWKNRHGNYYFRVRIPQKHQHLFPEKSELRLPLHTAHRVSAKMKARAMMVGFDNFWGRAEAMAKKNNQDFIQLGYEIMLTSEVDLGGISKQTTVLKMSPEEHELLGEEAVGHIISSMGNLKATPAASQSDKASRVSTAKGGPLLSETLDVFVKRHSWDTPKTEIQYRSTLGILISLVGDKPLNSVDKKDARELVELLAKLPPNINATHSPYKGMSVTEIAATNPATTLSATTIGHHLTRLKSFFNWTESNYDEMRSNPFKGIKAAKRPKKEEARSPFSDPDIEKIFTCYLYSSDAWPRAKSGKENAKFWMPLILAFTGCRLNEACQLYTNDVYKDDGIWVFDFNENQPDKQLKGTFARKVPLHKALIQIGLPEFVQKQKDAGHERLFPELIHVGTGDGYGRAIGEFCRDLFVSIGVNGTPHCFRHNVTRILTSKDSDLIKVQAILGHKGNQSVTEASYGANQFSNAQKRVVINKLDYGISFDEISYTAFKRRTA